MKKIPCLFERDFTDRRRPVLLRAVTPGLEWVLEGLGTPTRKRDGTACYFLGGKLYKRYDVKRGRPVPLGAMPCQEPDPVTGHWPHWVEVGPEPESRWHVEALTGLRSSDGSRFRPRATLVDGRTYELCGPRVNTNHEALAEHEFFEHGAEVLGCHDRSWDELRAFLERNPYEGVVFWRDGEPQCKLRRADYGLAWPLARVIGDLP